MRFTAVQFRYHRGAPWVLREVTAQLRPGRITEITGANGAGKSTLLRLAAGLLRPVDGSITERPAVVGFAPERFPAAQPFTVAGYLRHTARMRKASFADALEWAARLGLEPLLDTRLPELSKGSAQKVGLTQALFPSPGLLVLDEPFAGLDPDTRGELPSMLASLAASGTTVLVSDHQATLRELPDVDRLQVRGHTLSASLSAGSHAVIELVVPAAEADDAVRRLRADGYAVRGVRR